ncbi:MAG: elongation factor P [Sphingomonadales bacterium]|jgi:elongation factor P
MKLNGNAIRPGNVIEHNGSLWRAIKTQHTQPGKGGAYLQVELKNLFSGSKLNERFRASETVIRAVLEQKDFQYLYKNGDIYAFMNAETYEQIEISEENLGNSTQYLQDGMIVSIEFHEETPLGIALPDTIILTVVETEPVVKNQTATSSYKPAIMANGMRIMVPQFVNTDDKIVIQTEDGTYSKRAD